LGAGGAAPAFTEPLRLSQESMRQHHLFSGETMKYLVVMISGERHDVVFALSPDSANKLAKTPLAEMMAFCENLKMPEGGPHPVASSEEIDVEIAPLMCNLDEHEEFRNEVITWSNDMHNW
jgi:hypothetical protein